MQFQEDQKGLFTFYRQQKQFEDQIIHQKKEEQQRRQRLKKEQERKKQLIIEKQRQIWRQRQLQLQRLKQKVKTQRRLLYQSKPKTKYERKKFGNSVLIINSKKNQRQENESKNAKKKKQNENQGYFLQNKQIPFTFGQVSLEKTIVDPSLKKQMKQALPIHYYNNYQPYDEEKYLPSISFEKLPSLKNKTKTNQSPFMNSEKKNENKLKGGSSEILNKAILKAREKLEKNQEKIQGINLGKEPEESLGSKLRDRQKKLIEIIKSRRYQ